MIPYNYYDPNTMGKLILGIRRNTNGKTTHNGGAGRRLAENLPLKDNMAFKLAETKVFHSGCVGLKYVRKNDQRLGNH